LTNSRWHDNTTDEMHDTIGDKDRRFLIRVGNDYRTLEKLLTPDFEQKLPLQIDGVVVDGNHSTKFKDLRERLSGDSQVLIDHQVYRLQQASCRDHPSLVALPYAHKEREYRPEDFADDDFIKTFVQSVLNEQHKFRVTDYLAPSFFVSSPESPWLELNRRLLGETMNQVGAQVYATVCIPSNMQRNSIVIDWTINSGAAGVYLLVTPLSALTDPIPKLVQFLDLAKRLSDAGLTVIAGRQPAFGLAMMAMGVASFDAGIAQSERFNLANLVRPKRRTEAQVHPRHGAPRGIYLADLMTTVPAKVAKSILSVPSLKALLVCDELCCRGSFQSILVRPEEHFLWARAREVAAIRSDPKDWRPRRLAERVSRARQVADKIKVTLGTAAPSFEHLDRWPRVIEQISASFRVSGR